MVEPTWIERVLHKIPDNHQWGEWMEFESEATKTKSFLCASKSVGNIADAKYAERQKLA